MTIDGCAHDFAGLADQVLPHHVSAIEAAIRSSMSMTDFAMTGVGVRSLLKRHEHADDFSGCYVLMEAQPIYVGISRGVFGRLRQHVTGRTHFDASLAYRMAEAEAPHGKTRNAAMDDAEFAILFLTKRAYLRTLKVAAIAIGNPVELYLFEVYAALALGTSKWNTFRTH